MPAHEKKRQHNNIIIFGEVLYDCFPDGRRILGGAPFNVAWSLNGFGRQPLFISSVGKDAKGDEIEKHMTNWGLSTDGLQKDPAHQTGEVHVSIQDNEPSYEICADRAWDYIEDEGHACSGLMYHGLLALRNKVSRNTLENLVCRSNSIRFFDINLRPPYVDLDVLKQWVHGVDWLKLNIDELPHLLDTQEIPFNFAEPFIDQVRDQYQVENVLLTGGKKGAMMRGLYGNASCIPAPEPENLIDTVGAGDAFSAYTIHALLHNQSAFDIIEGASRFASNVCGLRGALTTDRTFYESNDA